MEKPIVSKATLGRLPEYLNYLKSITAEHISATAVANALSLGEVLVRKDLAAVSGTGKPKVGYVVKDLIKDIAACLGSDKTTPAVLVGAGKLGRALLEYDGFQEYGVKIIAGFDCNNQTLYFGRNKLPVYSMDGFKEFCEKNVVRIGIITVGSGSAQQVCDEMIKSGIKAIWNFAPTHLDVPSNILVQNENMATSLAVLSVHLQAQIKEEKK